MAYELRVVRHEFVRTLDEILDEHEECLKENWEDLPTDIKNQRLERVANVRREIWRLWGAALNQVGRKRDMKNGRGRP